MINLFFVKLNKLIPKFMQKKKKLYKRTKGKNSQKILEKPKRRGFALPDVELILKL